MKFRDLRADEIEVRVAMVREKGVSLLLYKNARCDMAILDETVGAGCWQREHYECKGNLFCRVGIKCGDEWIWKADCGAETYTEKEKGESSDSFKRACFNWGIGRELYTSPFIWVPADKCKISNGKCNDKFYVSHIEIKDKKIVALAINNSKGVVFQTGIAPTNEQPVADLPPASIDKLQKRIKELIKTIHEKEKMQNAFILKTACEKVGVKEDTTDEQELIKIGKYLSEWAK